MAPLPHQLAPSSPDASASAATKATSTPPSTTRRLRRRALAIVLLAFTAGAATGAIWLTRRPFTYQPPNRVLLDAPEGLDDDPLGDDQDELSWALGAPPDDDDTDGALPDAAREGNARDDDETRTLPFRGAQHTERAPAPVFATTESYLLVGVDHTRSGLWGRADTLVVAVFDDTTGHVGLVSVPRDLRVDVPGHGPARVNATLRIATRAGRDPLETLRAIVEDLLAIPIRHVVVGDLEVFERTIDRLGGVEIDVPCPIRDNFIDPRAPSGRRSLDVAEGRRRLDGVTAAMYVRSRHGRSDWDRARRQQAVLFGLRDRIRELGPSAWGPVLGVALEGGVTTTMSRLELLALLRRTASVRSERLHGLLLGHREVRAHRGPEGRAMLVADPEAVDRALAGLFDAPAPGAPHRHARCQPADAALR
ncbi:MAG: LCP family protein [Myxococcales bacterium]|nr:LCP family protein [Myxococcales bacterium]